MPTTNPPLRVVLADDHAMFRDGFKVLMRRKGRDCLRIVGEASDGRELLDVVRTEAPDVVITDVRMPRMDGLEACRHLNANHPHLGIIALTSGEEDALIYDMFQAGARGYLFKHSSAEEILTAVTAVGRGDRYFSNATSPTLLRKLANSRLNRKALLSCALSEKEKQILVLLCRELTTKEIASEMLLNHRTVEDCSRSLKEKLGAKNLVGLALSAVKMGIVSLEELPLGR